MAVAYLEKKRPGKKWLAGEMSTRDYIEHLSNEWGAFRSYSGNVLPGNSGKIPPEKIEEALNKVKGKPATQAMKGVVKPYSFLNAVDGIFEMNGPDTGYKVPEYLTGGQPVIGHGLEWLIKMSNKFIILPGVNKEYNVYQDPAKAFTRYEQIGQQGGVEVAGLIGAMDDLLFGRGKKGPSTLKYGDGFPQKRTYKAYGEDGAEILRTLGGIPVKGASLPEGTVTPVAIPKDTVTGTTGAVVAMVQPMIQYVPVPGPERVEYVSVPANPFVAARASIEMLQLQGLT